MPRRPAVRTPPPPTPYVYEAVLLVPLRVVAFRKRDVVEKVRQFGAGLGGMLDAVAGPAFELGEPRVQIVGKLPLLADDAESGRQRPEEV